MHKLLRTLTAALALSAAASGHAAVIGFDTASVIDIDNGTNLATYSEAGFAITGDAASFLTIDGIGTGASGGLFLVGGSTLSLTAQDGSLFSFSGLDAGLFGSDPATLSLTGIFGDSSQLSSNLALSDLGSFSFANFNGLSELRISSNADAVLDNVMTAASPVPEPGTTAMLLLGLGALVGTRRLVRKGAVS